MHTRVWLCNWYNKEYTYLLSYLKKVTNNNIKRKTKELDWTYTSRRFPLKRHHRGEDGGEKDERKAAEDDAGRDDDQWIRRTEGKSTAENRMASLEVGTCRRAENLKRKILKSH